jgi:hypothetical protein
VLSRIERQDNSFAVRQLTHPERRSKGCRFLSAEACFGFVFLSLISYRVTLSATLDNFARI